MALAEALRQGREWYPDKLALIADDESWSYGRLDAVTDRMAAGLLEVGIRSGDRIALHFVNRPELVLAYYACFKIGAVAVPLNVRLKGAELEYILQHSGARLYLGQHDLFSEVEAIRADLHQARHRQQPERRKQGEPRQRQPQKSGIPVTHVVPGKKACGEQTPQT